MKKIYILIGLGLLILTLANMIPTTQPVANGIARASNPNASIHSLITPPPPVTEKDKFKDKVLQGFQSGQGRIPDHTLPNIQWIDVAGNWAVAFVYLDDINTRNTLEISPLIIFGEKKGTGWIVYFPTESNYSALIQQVPTTLLPTSFLDALGVHAENLSTTTARNAGKLPWTYGQWRQVTQDRRNTDPNGSHTPGSLDEWAWDFGLSTDEAVLASRSGVVAHIYTATPKNTGCLTCDWTKANRVVIDHEDGTATLYLHLSDKTPPVFELQRVVAGQIIGYSDNTGRTGGPHLHFALQTWNSSWNGAVAGTLWYQRSLESLFNDPNVSGGNPTYPNSYRSGNVSSTYLTVNVNLRDLNGASVNRNPAHRQRPVSIEIYDANNQLKFNGQSNVNYNSQMDNFIGTVDLGITWPTGIYTVILRLDYTLKARVSGIQTITNSTTNVLPSTALKVGDINNDNRLSILDYNILLDCFSDIVPARNCADVSKKRAADVTDDGKVQQFDYNLWLRILTGGQTGD